MRVLLVEDNPAMQQEMARTIGAIPGGRVVQVADAADTAIDWLDANPEGWDLAIVDLFLATGHGFQVLRRCKRRGPHQRAVVVSNYTRAPVADYARQAGADRFFDKSLELDALVQYCKGFGDTLARSG